MTDFILVRHGETVWHAENRYAGRSDVELTERGHAQAAALAQWAATAHLDGVLCSPLTRARLTAVPAAEAVGVLPRIDERLLEVDFGRGDGLTRDEMGEAFPERLAAFLDDPVTHHLPGGEDPRRAAERAGACLAETARELPDSRILVVAHSTLLRLLLCRQLGIPLAAYRRVFPELHNGTLTELRLRNGQASLIQFNSPLIPVLTAP